MNGLWAEEPHLGVEKVIKHLDADRHLIGSGDVEYIQNISKPFTHKYTLLIYTISQLVSQVQSVSHHQRASVNPCSSTGNAINPQPAFPYKKSFYSNNIFYNSLQ